MPSMSKNAKTRFVFDSSFFDEKIEYPCMNSFPSPCDSSRSFFVKAQPVWKKGTSSTLKPFVLDLLEKEGVKDNFTDYPLRDAWLIEFREKIIDLLK